MGNRRGFTKVIAPCITLLGLLLIAPGSVSADEEKDVATVEKAVDSSKTTLRPEITCMVIYDGSVRSVRYYAPRLSAAEKVVLKELEEAENEVAALQAGMSAAAALDRERVRQAEAITALYQQYYVERRWAMLDLAERRNVRRDIALLYSQYANCYGYGGCGPAAPVPEAGKEVVVLAERLEKATARLRAAQAQVVFEQERVVAVLPKRP